MGRNGTEGLLSPGDWRVTFRDRALAACRALVGRSRSALGGGSRVPEVGWASGGRGGWGNFPGLRWGSGKEGGSLSGLRWVKGRAKGSWRGDRVKARG